MIKPELLFYDIKARKKFTTRDYSIVKRRAGKYFAKTKAPSGVESWVLVKKEFGEKHYKGRK